MNDTSSNLPRQKQIRARIRLGMAGLALLCTGALLWRFTPIAEYSSADRLLGWLEVLRESPWSPLAMVALFTLGGLVFFPLTVLITVTGLMFEPALAIAISLSGSLANALVTYHIGARLLASTARDALGPVVTKLKALLDNSGIVAVAIVRMLPIAPFTAVNMAAGLLGVQQRDYLIGTALGVAPGVLALTLFGRQLQAVLRNPTWLSVLALCGIVAGWISLSLLLQKAIARWRRRR